MTSLFVQDVTVSESDGFIDMVVRLDVASTTAVSVNYASSNSSAGGNDYVYPGGTLTFAPGETSKVVRVQLRDDLVAEGLETCYFTLSSPVNATLGRSFAAMNIVDNDTAVDTPQIFVEDVFVDEKQGTASFVVRLGLLNGEAAHSGTRVDFTTQDDSAQAGQDYVARSGTLLFEPGESVKTVVVDLLDDALAEGVERFNFVLQNAVNAQIADALAVAEIGLSDGTGSALPRISVEDVTVGELDGYVTLAVRLHAPSTNTISVNYASSNSSAGGNDYYYPGGTLTFAPGETIKSVQVQLANDLVAEGPEAYFFTLSKPVNATLGRSVAAVNIVDNDTAAETPQIFVEDVFVDEKQGTASFVVRLGLLNGEAANSGTRVDFATQNDSALAGQDYVARSGTLLFAPGESVKTVVVDLLDDVIAEGAERFNLVLQNAVNAHIADGLAVAEIGLSDGTGSALPRISVDDVTVGEIDGYVTMAVRLHAPSTNAVSVNYSSSNSSAGGNDYYYPGGTLNFAPGETIKSVQVQLANDLVAEGPEAYYFTLSSPVNATLGRAAALVNIVDNDTAVETPQLFVDDVLVDEQQGTASFVVRLGKYFGQGAGGTLSVDFSTRNGTAIAGQDFVARNGTLTFQPGESTQTVVIDLLDDALSEPLERFDLVLSRPVGASLGDGVAVAEIGRSDGVNRAQPSFSVADVTASESDGWVQMAVTLDAASSNLVTVRYSSSNATAGGNDYYYPGGSLSFAPGETTKHVLVQLANDTVTESIETFQFVLSSPTNATLGRNAATVTIIDDDGDRAPLSYGRSDDVYTVSDALATFIEAADGGFDIVRSSASFTLPANLEGVFLTDQALNATGNDSNNLFQGNSRDNTINGLGGIDTMVYAGASTAYAVNGNTTSRTVSGPGDGTDTLLSIERLQFSDTVVAYDTTPDGHTWGAYAMLNAAFNAAPSAADLGHWTSQLDQWGNLRDLAQSMIHFYAPGVSNEALVTHLWGTIVGTPISGPDLASFVGLIENGTFTQASLLEFVTTHPLNTQEFASIVGLPLTMDSSWFDLPPA